MTSDQLNTYLYDAQGQVCAVQTGPGSYTGYLYDAEGHRVAKGTLQSLTCDSAQLQITAAYFIGPDGATMTEIDGSGDWVRTDVSGGGQFLATYTPSGIHYPVTDWLGTKRVTVNPNLALNNSIEETCASFPFGDQQNCTTPIDASPKHYTGKERDTESGLDYFGARYYASNAGRWLSPDDDAYQDLSDPQSLNLYAYVHNSPLIFVDPDGHEGFGLTSSNADPCSDETCSEPSGLEGPRIGGATPARTCDPAWLCTLLRWLSAGSGGGGDFGGGDPGSASFFLYQGGRAQQQINNLRLVLVFSGPAGHIMHNYFTLQTLGGGKAPGSFRVVEHISVQKAGTEPDGQGGYQSPKNGTEVSPNNFNDGQGSLSGLSNSTAVFTQRFTVSPMFGPDAGKSYPVIVRLGADQAPGYSDHSILTVHEHGSNPSTLNDFKGPAPSLPNPYSGGIPPY